MDMCYCYKFMSQMSGNIKVLILSCNENKNLNVERDNSACKEII